jgi:hypothetical protein
VAVPTPEAACEHGCATAGDVDVAVVLQTSSITCDAFQLSVLGVRQPHHSQAVLLSGAAAAGRRTACALHQPAAGSIQCQGESLSARPSTPHTNCDMHRHTHPAQPLSRPLS